MAISGNKLYSCSNDCTIKLWDLNKLEPIATIFKSDRDAVQKLILSRDGTTLYSGDDKGIVSVNGCYFRICFFTMTILVRSQI